MGDGIELWIIFLYTIVENTKSCIVKLDVLKIKRFTQCQQLLLISRIWVIVRHRQS